VTDRTAFILAGIAMGTGFALCLMILLLAGVKL
jgi:hypothetical protein